MKETEFKINKKKRNIIIAIVASIVVLAGIITGVVIYNINNKPVETDEPITNKAKHIDITTFNNFLN